MASFWDMISGNEAAMQQINPTYGVPQQFVRDSALNALGQIGGLLMAAGQPVDPAVRAQMLGQIGSVGSGMSSDIYKAAQSRLMGAQYQQQMAETEAQKRFDQMLGGVGGPAAAGGAPGAAPAAPGGGLQGLSPAEVSYLRSLPTAKARQDAYATLMQQKLTKPSTEQEIPLTEEERTNYNIPEGQPAFKKVRNLPDGTQAVTGFNIPNIQRPESALNAPMFQLVRDELSAGRSSATNATSELRANQNMRELLDAGVLTGSFAPSLLQSGKVVSAIQGAFGIQDSAQLSNLIANTETFQTEGKKKVLSMVKDLGPNPSNADRDYIDAVSGGSIPFDEKSIRKILEIADRAARRKIEYYNNLVKPYREDPKILNDAQRRILSPILQPVEPPKGRSQTFTTGKGMSWSVED